MTDNAVTAQVHALIEAKDFARLKAMVCAMDKHDLAELLGGLEGQDMAVVFRLLGAEQAAEVLGDLAIEQQESLLLMLSSQNVAAVINEMPPDDRTELLEELPGELAQKLLATLRGSELQIARNLLGYPEDSIGRLMTPEYIAVRADWTIQRVFEHIRQVGPAKETLSVIYVVNEAGKLIDELTLEQLVLAEPTAACASDVMDNKVIASLRASEDRESAVEMFRKYDAVVLPVVTAQGVLVGIVTVDDVLDVAKAEDTEDFQKMVGMGVLEYSYFGTGYLEMIRKRLPWLILLLLAQTLTTVALTNFSSLPMFVVLAVFIPLVNSPAGNTGSQTAGLMIRGLAVRELDVGDWRRVLWREIAGGVSLGLVLGAIGYCAALIFSGYLPTEPHPAGDIALSVALALVIVVTLGNLAGSMLPFLFKRLGLDPAVTSAPFLASLMDVSGVVIYFSIAMMVLAAL